MTYSLNTLCKIGYKCEKPKATFYVWVNCKGDSMKFANKLLDVGVAVTPGIGFGKYGEGYARITFTQPKERIKEACNESPVPLSSNSFLFNTLTKKKKQKDKKC